MIKTGEILRKRDGNYCFSCNHCDKYFDVLQDIIDHMNIILPQQEAKDNVKLKIGLLSNTEFVDVSVPIDVKYELIEDDVNDVEDNKEWSYLYDENMDESTQLPERICVQEKFSDNVQSTNHVQVEVTKTPDMPTSIKKQNCTKNQMLVVKSPVETQGNVQCEDDQSTQNSSIKCCWCSEFFNDLGLMLNHLTDDHNKKPSDVHSCKECKLFFKNVKLLTEHTFSRHTQDEYEKFEMEIQIENTKPIQCAVCHFWTYGNKSFDAHTKREHKMYRILQCYVCGIFKKKPSGLIDHLKVHDRFRKYRCYECDKIEPKITNPNDLRTHKCVLCGCWFPNHATIRSHITDIHGQDQIYDCSICDDYTFKTDWDLKMHCVNAHNILMDYKCNICSKNCKSMQSLKEHQKSHSSNTNTNECTVCGSKFRRKDYLVRHIRSHSQVKKDFNCYICNKPFPSNGYLKNHIKRHTEKKMHQCHVCGNRFLLPGLLRKHMKEHEGEVWKCEQCQKEFSNKSKLTAHEKTHVTERNFRCDVCLKTYKTSKNLQQHKLVHSLERRIKCRICNMTFNQGQEHLLHLQTHTSDVI